MSRMNNLPPQPIVIDDTAVTVKQYLAIRRAVGWDSYSPEQVSTALGSTQHHSRALSGVEVIGTARVVGDGAIFFYVQDVMVVPEHQRQGVGRRLVDHAVGWVVTNHGQGAHLMLSCQPALRSFYAILGFRPMTDVLMKYEH